eukprot:SAG31_NODE_17230_length_678_cov_1.518135_1_plen_76_part_00
MAHLQRCIFRCHAEWGIAGAVVQALRASDHLQAHVAATDCDFRWRFIPRAGLFFGDLYVFVHPFCWVGLDDVLIA